MNTVSNPVDKGLTVAVDPDITVRKYGIGENVVTFWPSGLVTARLANNVFGFYREDAIELAKTILIENNVPFCNRVEGSGTCGN